MLTATARERLSHVLESDEQRTIVGPDERGPGKATAPACTGQPPRLEVRCRHRERLRLGHLGRVSLGCDARRRSRAAAPSRSTSSTCPRTRLYLKTGAMARHALEYYSKLWFPYAWPQFTQVDGPENGMEYPMLTMSGPGFGVTDHEIGHQWWPMMVGRERDLVWLDGRRLQPVHEHPVRAMPGTRSRRCSTAWAASSARPPASRRRRR